MIRRTVVAAFLALAASFLALPAGAQLYATTGAGATSNLYLVNPRTGATTVIGAVGFGVTGLAYNPSNGVMYGVTTGPSACSRCLITIDVHSGAGTVVGPLGQTISELEFGANGTLYGWAEGPDSLASINTATGAATVVGPSGLSTFGDGMALLNGTMYVMPEGDNSSYYTVNTATGATTFAGTLSNSPIGTGAAVSAATVDPTNGDVYASINNFGAPPSYLVRVNMATGRMTTSGVTVTGIDALAFVFHPMPTMTEWSLIAMALLLGAIGIFTLRRR